MLTRLVSVFFLVSAAPLLAQAKPTAIRQADLQVGAGYSSASSDYEPQRFNGGTAYATLDLTNHYGGEFDLHQVNSSTGDQVYERSYEWGFRYHRTYGRFAPYARIMYGRGIFNFSRSQANFAYNMADFGGGVDAAATERIHLRADYEYQHWSSFPPSGLTPHILTIGVAYHVPGGLWGSRRH